MSLRSLACVVSLLMSLPLPAAGQPRPTTTAGQRSWVVGGWWRHGHGLPQDRVIALRQTRDGYLWAGTRGGVARFDGVRFTTWEQSAASAPPAGEVFALAEDADGGLWLGVNGGGLARFKGGHFTTVTTSDGLVDNLVRSLSVGFDRSLWVGTDRGLSRYRDGRFTNYVVKDGLASDAVRAVFADPRRDVVFIGSDRSLQRLEGGRFTKVALSPTDADVSVDAIIQDGRGRLWVATSAGLSCVDGTSVVTFGPADGLSSRSVRAVYEDSSGRIWAATGNGLDCAEVTSGGPVRFASVITGIDGTTIIEDRERSIWVGSRGHGLVRLQRSLFTVFDVETGLPSIGVTTVFQSRAGVVWSGTGTVLAAVRGNRVDVYGREDGLPDRAVSSLAEDVSNHLWVGTEAGLYRSTKPVRCQTARCEARFAPVTGHPALQTHVRVLRADGDVMLAGTDADGVIAVPVRGTSEPTLLVSGEIRALEREDSGHLWVGTRRSGLMRWTPTGTTTYASPDGLPHNDVQCLFLDRDRTLWIGTRLGLAWIRGGRLSTTNALQSLGERHIYGITEDRKGNLWLSTGIGVFAVAKQQLLAHDSHPSQPVSTTAYGLEDGLPSTLCALGHDPVMTTDANGHVWVATLGGLVSIDPGVAHPSAVTPLVHLESITINQHEFAPDSPAEAPQDRGLLVFRFSAPSFTDPDGLTFRYRLEGFDPAWIEGGTAREARFTNIPPGQYRFAVMARSGEGVLSDHGAFGDVYLVPHFYQRVWFSVLVVLGIIATGAGIGVSMHRIRVRRLKDNERELAKRVDDALAHIKVLSGLLPICAWCRRVRDDDGYWTQIESYVREHSQAKFSHGMCPDCAKAHFPEEFAEPPARTSDGGANEG